MLAYSQTLKFLFLKQYPEEKSIDNNTADNDDDNDRQIVIA